MSNTKLTALTANTSPSLDDLLYLVDSPGGTPLSQKITVQNVLNLIRAVPYVAKTANYPLTADDEFVAVNTNAGNVTLTLPAVATARVGKRYVIKVIEATGDTIIDGATTETIDGAETLTLSTLYQCAVIVNSGAAWYIESLYTPV